MYQNSHDEIEDNVHTVDSEVNSIIESVESITFENKIETAEVSSNFEDTLIEGYT